MKLDLAKANMARLKNTEDELRLQLENLANDMKVVRSSKTNITNPAALARADLRWQKWADMRRTLINSELADLLARKETVRIQLLRAFGENNAATALKKELRKVAKQRAKQMRTYES